MDHHNVPLDFHSFCYVFCPPLLGYYVLALLVCIPETRKTRLSVLGPVLYLAYQAAVSLDFSRGKENLVYLNQGLALMMVTLSMRCMLFAFAAEPYRKLHDSVPKDESRSSDRRRSIFLDALDLCFNARGCGWNWSEGLCIPPDNRRVDSVQAFTSRVAVSAILHLVMFDFVHYHVQAISPNTFGLHSGTIFDPELPPSRRFARSSYISLNSGLVIYCSMQALYDISTLVGVLGLKQSPQDWPPFFGEPWKASSLTEFWAKRWHQTFRDSFVGLGGYPMSLLFGRVGAVIGSFIVSGILHLAGLWGMGRGINLWDVFGMVGYFMMMGVGVVVEGIWKKQTGNRVEGWSGKIWTFLWAVGWANVLVDAWARGGLISSQFFPDSSRPAYLVFGPLV